MERRTIIIIGGGIAGLVAARSLSSRYHVIVLEAMRRFGGRICALDKKAFPQPIEGGAEFIHGKAAQTMKLLKVAGLTYTKVTGKFYRRNKSSFIVDEQNTAGWEEMLKQMASLKEDLSLSHFLDQYFSDDSYHQLREQALGFAEGFDLADPSKVSVKTLYREWSHQANDHRVDDGYAALVKFLVKDCRKRGCKLISGCIVKTLEWEQHMVKITTLDNQVYNAEQSILTVPLGVLQEKGGLSISIQPPVPTYFEAASKIGYGKVIKIVLAFKSRFWKKDAGFFLSEDDFSAWWTQLPSTAPVLTGWAGGPKAEALSWQGSSVLLEKAMKSLSDLFLLDVMTLKESLEGWHVFNWQKQKSILGGYSYATPETEAALLVLNTPIDETIFFAGEGLYSGDHPGTVEAAIVSAKSVTDHLLKR